MHGGTEWLRVRGCLGGVNRFVAWWLVRWFRHGGVRGVRGSYGKLVDCVMGDDALAHSVWWRVVARGGANAEGTSKA